MKSRYKLIVLVTVGLVVTGGTVAVAKGWFNMPVVVADQPDPASEWQKLVDHYRQLQLSSGLNMEGNIRLFDAGDLKKIKEQNTTVLQWQGKQYYYSIAGVKYYCDGEVLLQVDPINQYVILSKAPVMPDVDKQVLPQINHQDDQAAESFRITGKVEGDEKKRTLTIQNEMNPEVKRYSVVYDPVTYKITDIEIEWWKNNLAETNSGDNTWITRIQYKHHVPVQLDMEAEMKKVIAVKDGKIMLIGKEKDYKLEVIN